MARVTPRRIKTKIRKKIRVVKVPEHSKEIEWLRTIIHVFNPFRRDRTITQIREDIRELVEQDQFWEALKQLEKIS